MSMTRGTPASSQIVNLERMVEERDAEIERLRKLLQQVLTDAQAQDVLLEWWHLLECETVPNI